MGSQRRSGWPQDFLQPPSLRPVTARRSLLPGRVAQGERGNQGLAGLALEILETALITIMVLVLVRLVVVNYRVDGQSMLPTFQSGAYLLIDRVAYATIDASQSRLWPYHGRCERLRCPLFGLPQRGDVIVFWPPLDTERPYIKRVIAVPGEQVEIRAGQVYINGEPLAEGYTSGGPDYEIEPARVPEGHYFVLGDNRNNSTDSHLFGMVPLEQIVGRAWLAYWPLDRIGTVPALSSAGSAPRRPSEGR